MASAERVAVLASERDRVLRRAYPVGELLQAFVLFWKERRGAALGLHGPRASGRDGVPDNVWHVQIPDAVGADHGDYFPGEVPNAKQLAAARFADAVLAGETDPAYALAPGGEVSG